MAIAGRAGRAGGKRMTDVLGMLATISDLSELQAFVDELRGNPDAKDHTESDLQACNLRRLELMRAASKAR
jgi:hypothetical protein